MSDAVYFQQLAQRCFKYARDTFDLAVSARLRQLGEEFEKQAAERESKDNTLGSIIGRRPPQDRKQLR
jgi:hypothetical protein